MDKEKLLKQLDLLGFSQNDASVYLALVEHGPCNAGPIIQATRLHRNIVYVSLNHLITKKYVTEKSVRGRKNFALSSPEILQHEFSKKALVAEEVAKELTTAASLDPQEVSVHQGVEEYIDLMQMMVESLPENSEICGYGTITEGLFDGVMGPQYKKILDQFSDKKIVNRIIGNRRKKKLILADMAKVPKGMFEVRYFPVQLDDPAVITVFPQLDTLLYIIYPGGDFNITIFKIKNKTLAQNIHLIFRNLWKLCLR